MKRRQPKEMINGCCVCSEEQGWPDNPLVYCDGVGCNIAVHQACYGIVSVPKGNWYCKKCESVAGSSSLASSGNNNNNVGTGNQTPSSVVAIRCELCPFTGGALKQTDNGKWAHVVCALYIPEVKFQNVATMEPVVLSIVPRDRFFKTCYICVKNGKTERSTFGACMDCNRPNCKQQFHVPCAQILGLLCEEEGKHAVSITYCGYCEDHYTRKKKSTVTAIQSYESFSAYEDDEVINNNNNTTSAAKRQQKKKPSSANSTKSSGKKDHANLNLIINISHNPPKVIGSGSPSKTDESVSSVKEPNSSSTSTSRACSNSKGKRRHHHHHHKVGDIDDKDDSLMINEDTNLSNYSVDSSSLATANSSANSSPNAQLLENDTNNTNSNDNINNDASLLAAAAAATKTSAKKKNKQKDKSHKKQRKASKKKSRSNKSNNNNNNAKTDINNQNNSEDEDEEDEIVASANDESMDIPDDGSVLAGPPTVVEMKVDDNTLLVVESNNEKVETEKIIHDDQQQLAAIEKPKNGGNAVSVIIIGSGESDKQQNRDGGDIAKNKDNNAADGIISNDNNNNNNNKPPVGSRYGRFTEELLEKQWEQGSAFIMEQAEHNNVGALLSELHQVRMEVVRAEQCERDLLARRDRLFGVVSRLAIPSSIFERIESLMGRSSNQRINNSAESSESTTVFSDLSMVGDNPPKVVAASKQPNDIDVQEECNKNNALLNN